MIQHQEARGLHIFSGVKKRVRQAYVLIRHGRAMGPHMLRRSRERVCVWRGSGIAGERDVHGGQGTKRERQRNGKRKRQEQSNHTRVRENERVKERGQYGRACGRGEEIRSNCGREQERVRERRCVIDRE